MAIRDLQAVVYTDDEGNDWQTAADSTVFAQVNGTSVPLIGGSDYDGSPALMPRPRGLKPRGVYVQNGTSRRFVVCLTADAPLYAGTSTTVDLPVLGAAAATYTRIRAKRESDSRKFRNPAG